MRETACIPNEPQDLLDSDHALNIESTASEIPQRTPASPVLVPAFGFVTLFWLPLLGDIVSPNHYTIYHLSGPVSGIIVPTLLNLFLFTFLLALGLRWARQMPRLETIFWLVLLWATPWIVMRDVSVFCGYPLPHTLNLTVFSACFLAIVWFSWLWTPGRRSQYARTRCIEALVFKFLAFFGLILVLQTLWVGWQARHLNDVSSVTPPPAPVLATFRPRVIWIVFDELSYEQVIGARFPDLQLPAIDSFTQQSTVFTQVIPAGLFTQAILPSLISGIPVDSIRSSSDGQRLYLHVPYSAAHWQNFQPEQTVFAEAKSIGYHPAIVGWFNPYCRLLSGELSSCVWANNTTRVFPGATLLQKLYYPIACQLSRLSHFLFPQPSSAYDHRTAAQLHIDDYQQLSTAADQALANPSLDFVFLHMPIPHPGGIYDRRHGVLTTGPSTYIDNLALADKYLAHVRQTLQQRHEWDDATILIMGDHSWRTQLLWKSTSDWTEEEQRASHSGQFDDRPFYALKLPAQQTPARITSTVHALNTRSLLDALLRHQIKTPQQLNLWAQQSR